MLGKRTVYNASLGLASRSERSVTYTQSQLPNRETEGTIMTTSTPTASRGVSLHVKVFIDPAKLDDFFAAMKPCFEQVTAEPECMFFQIYVSSTEPGAISWVENW